MKRLAPLAILLLVFGIAAALAPISMNPGDTLTVHCPTTMSGTITANDAGLVCAPTPSPTPGGTTTLNPVADAYTLSSQPTVNFGSNVALRVDASPVMDSFLRFDTSGLSGTETLRIYAETGQATGFTVHSVSGIWTESTIDFSNQPALGASLGASGPVIAGTWYSIPVTGSSFALDTTNSTTLRLSSREGGHPPQLIVTGGVPSASPSPSATPTGTPTPTPASTLISTSTPAATPIPTGTPTSTPTAVAIRHFIVVWLENHEASSITASSMPYLFGLGTTYGTASQFYAVSHPSEPNYLAFWSGSTQGVTDDGVYDLSGPSLSSQIGAVSYIQAYPASGCDMAATYPSRVDGPGVTASNARKHNPAMSFTLNGGLCGNIQPLAAFDPLNPVSFVAPNLINDAHDGTLAQADAFLQAFLPQVFGSSDWAHTLLVVSFDEGTSNTNGGGHIYTMVARQGLSGFTSAMVHNHYGLLRTIEDVFGLPCLGAACSATPLSEFLAP